MSDVQYSEISKYDASEEMLSLDPKIAMALLSNRGYYEMVEGQPSMTLTGELQMEDSFEFVEGAPVQLIQTPEYPEYLPEGTQSKAGPGQPVFTVAQGSTLATGKQGKFSISFEAKGSGSGFLALLVGNYEHIPFQVIVHPAGFNVKTLSPKHKSFLTFFKHLL